jgi:hypothetical protein
LGGEVQGPTGGVVAVGGKAVSDDWAEPVANVPSVPVGVGEAVLVACGDMVGVAVNESAGVVLISSAGASLDTPCKVGWSGGDCVSIGVAVAASD